MANKAILRAAVFIAVAVLHVMLILFLAVNVQKEAREPPENARVMKLADFTEAPPPPPPPPEETALPQVESIAETMIETDEPPPVEAVLPGAVVVPANPWDGYLPQHLITTLPQFDAKELAAAVVYPHMAQRSGIEGQVYLELFVDADGLVRRIQILKENPPGRGFAEAAVRAFTGRRGRPAQANGEPVSCRYRYPVTFKLN
jgi:protein TonB